MKPALANLLILSDLHLNEGWLAGEGRYSQREDFFYDRAFFDLLQYHHALQSAPRYAGQPWLLILNGDTFDFEQVVALPEEGDDLLAASGVATYAELDEDRARFGLQTSAPEGRWKLERIARGHPLFFAALGWFVAQGHRILFLKGNHDPELYWPEVQAHLREVVQRAYQAYRRLEPETPPLRRRDLEERLRFGPWFYYDPYLHVYVEHGNQYEPSNHYRNHLNPRAPDDPQKLELPQGMALTRYLFNKLEAHYPYADNVRPVTRVFGWIMSEGPLTGLRVFLSSFCDLLYGWREILRRKLRRASINAPTPGSYGGLPPALVRRILDVAEERARFSWRHWGALAVDQVGLAVLNLGGLAALAWGSWSLIRRARNVRKGARLLLAALLLLNTGYSWAAVVNDDLRVDYMPRVAEDLARSFRQENVPLRAVVLGHSHIPRRLWLEEPGLWMTNTGSWIPVLVQHPYTWALTLNFVRVAAAEPDTPPELLEWSPEEGTPRISPRTGER